NQRDRSATRIRGGECVPDIFAFKSARDGPTLITGGNFVTSRDRLLTSIRRPGLRKSGVPNHRAALGRDRAYRSTGAIDGRAHIELVHRRRIIGEYAVGDIFRKPAFEIGAGMLVISSFVDDPDD